MASCTAIDAVMGGMGMACTTLSNTAKNCAADCLNPFNWAGGKKFKAAKAGGKKPPHSRGGPPRDPRTSNYLPDPDALGYPHTTLGTRQGRKGPYTQGATFDKDGNFLGRTDVTNHGRPNEHTNPHWHPAKGPNSTW